MQINCFPTKEGKLSNHEEANVIYTRDSRGGCLHRSFRIFVLFSFFFTKKNLTRQVVNMFRDSKDTYRDGR